MISSGVQSKNKAYSLENFLYDCKKHKGKIEIDSDAIDDAVNLLHLNGETRQKLKEQITDFIAQYKPAEFDYVNTKPFRKGFNGENPLVDAYTLHLKFYDIYIAFCIVKTNNGWFIKSFHSDNSHNGNGDTISIGEIFKSKGKINYEK